MNISRDNLPLLAHPYVPRYWKVGPGPRPEWNAGAFVPQQQVGG